MKNDNDDGLSDALRPFAALADEWARDLPERRTPQAHAKAECLRELRAVLAEARASHPAPVPDLDEPHSVSDPSLALSLSPNATCTSTENLSGLSGRCSGGPSAPTGTANSIPAEGSPRSGSSPDPTASSTSTTRAARWRTACSSRSPSRPEVLSDDEELRSPRSQRRR